MSNSEMSEIYKKVLNKDFKEFGIEAKDIPYILKDIDTYFRTKISYLKALGGEVTDHQVKAYFNSLSDDLVSIIKNYWRYYNYKKDIAETYKKTNSWGDVFATNIYSDMDEPQEAFVDYVEEVYKTEVKNAKHLQELTEITHLSSYYKDGKNIKIKEEAKQKEQAIKELEETLTSARFNKYLRTLETALREGATYEDLLKIKPNQYKLPKSWTGCLASDQYSSILWAISEEYLLDEPAGLMLLPSPRVIAKEVKAPYSVIMDAYNITRN